MGKNDPMPLFDVEWREAFEAPVVQQIWGIGRESALTADVWKDSVYAVKFDCKPGARASWVRCTS